MSVPGSLRLGAGMVGGGPGAMIGEAHRQAMRLDDQYAHREIAVMDVIDKCRIRAK
jgi:hypothetical protein